MPRRSTKKKGAKGRGKKKTGSENVRLQCCKPDCNVAVEKDQSSPCPLCSQLFCSVHALQFIGCENNICGTIPRCVDCAFGKIYSNQAEENLARRKRGEEVVVNTDRVGYPSLICGNTRCSKIYCFECATSSTEGHTGFCFCMKCTKMVCFDCCISVGQHSDDYMASCNKCETTVCLECDPDFNFGLGVDEWACSTCYAASSASAGEKAKKSRACANPDCKSDKGTNTTRCTCKSVRFCGKECQTTMWPAHKKECKAIRKELRRKIKKG